MIIFKILLLFFIDCFIKIKLGKIKNSIMIKILKKIVILGWKKIWESKLELIIKPKLFMKANL